MPRPNKDGTPAAKPNRRRLTEGVIRRARAERAAYAIWDSKQRGLAVRVQPTGQKSYKVVYSFHSRARWLHLGDASALSLADARRIAAKIMAQVAEGADPLAERKAERGDTFGQLALAYVELWAKRHNKSWKQADALVRRHLITRWGDLKVKSITRADVKAAIAAISAPIVANQTLAAASAIFSWAMREDLLATNPCVGVPRNPTTSRERVLSDLEIPRFWHAVDVAGLLASSALKVILLTGQRPGEITHMQRAHVADGWWTMPGKLEGAWPGTKNGDTHRVWLPKLVQHIVAELDGPVPFSGCGDLALAMRDLCKRLNIPRTTPHDLRRTHGTTITRLGFGREAMNRIQNHREGGIADVYDQHKYAAENQKIMEAVTRHIINTAEGRAPEDNVIHLHAGES